jgi:small conductance mechanosensitive channel
MLSMQFLNEFSFSQQLLQTALQAFPKVMSVFGILAITRWIAHRGIQIANRLLDGMDDTLQSFVLQAMSILVWVLGGLAAINTLGIETTSLITALGAAGVALSLTLQNSLSQLAAGIMLVSLRPFEVGDTIEGAGVIGRVDSIGLFSTTVVTAEQLNVALPNNALVSGALKTRPADAIQRLELEIDIRDRRIQPTITSFIVLMRSQEQIATDPVPQCYVSSIYPEGTVLLLRFWCPAESAERLRSNLLQTIQEQLQARAIQ